MGLTSYFRQTIWGRGDHDAAESEGNDPSSPDDIAGEELVCSISFDELVDVLIANHTIQESVQEFHVHLDGMSFARVHARKDRRRRDGDSRGEGLSPERDYESLQPETFLDDGVVIPRLIRDVGCDNDSFREAIRSHTTDTVTVNGSTYRVKYAK